MILVFTSQSAFARSKGQDALDLGAKLYKKGRYQEAVTSFKNATTLDPGLIKAWENLGWAYYKSGQTKQVLLTWETILKIRPENREIRNAIGFLFMEKNQWRRAIPHLTTSLKSAPDQNLVRLRLGKAHLKVGQTDRAVDLFKQALKIQPDSWEALIHLAQAYGKSDRRHLIVSLLKKYLASYPGSFNDEKREWIAVKLSHLFARKGDRSYGRSRFKKAEAAYKQALNWTPGNKTILQNLGWALEKQGKYDEAVKAWLKIVDQGYTKFRLFHQIANAYYKSGQRDQAEVWYQNTRGIDPSNENIQFRLFELAMKKKAIPNALNALQHAFVSEKADQIWSMTAANHFIRNGNIKRGVKFFLKRLSHSSSPETTKMVLGRLYAKMGSRAREAGNVLEAMLNYEKAILHDALNAPAYRDLGWLYRHADKQEESERVWKQYQKKFPDKTEPHNLLARLYLNQGEYEKSLMALKMSLKIDPDQAVQKLMQAKALHWNKQYPEAVEKMNRIVQEYPGHLPVQYFYGEVLMRHQDFKRGRTQWRKVLDMGAKNPRAHYYWIKSLYEVGEYETAIKEAHKFLDQHPPYEPVIKLLVDDALFRQDKHQAVFWYEKLLKLFGDNPGEWLELSKLYMGLDRTAQATDYLKKAERKFPDDVEVQIAIGDLKLKEGKYEEALEVFKHIGRINPDNRRAFIGTFHTLIAVGRIEEAIQHLQSNQGVFFKDYEVSLQMGKMMTAMKETEAAKTYYSRVAEPVNRGRYIPILLYHGLSGHSRSRNLWVQRFDHQLKSLAETGYTTLTVAELGDILNKKLSLPEKPILITFDDARRDAFHLGDPILEKYGMKATMFVPTARIHEEDPFFADWDRTREYVKSGRWDMQAHGHNAHDLIPVDSQGGKGFFLTNFIWFNKKNRQETSKEFYARLDGDYQQNIKLLQTQIPGLNVVGYAYPFSEAGQYQNGNAGSASAINQTLLAKYFQFGFIQDRTAYNRVEPGKVKTFLLRRFSVPRDWDGGRLVQYLAEAHPSHVAQVALAKSQYWDGHYSDAGKIFTNLISQEPRLKDKFQFYLANISYQGGNHWESKKFLEGISEQDSILHPKFEELREAVAWKNRPRIGGGFNFFRDSNDRTSHSESARINFPLEIPLELMLEGGVLNFKEEGRSDIDGGQVSAGFHWGGWKSLHFEGKFRHRAFSQRKDTQNFWLSGKYQKNIHTVRFNGSKRDIDTVEAIGEGIQVKTYSLGYQVRYSPAFLGRMGVARQDYDDGNTGSDIRGSLRYQLPNLKNWKIGADLSYRDSDFEADAYYTPDQLLIGFGRILYQRSLGKDAKVRADFGLGAADDKLNGVRWATNGGIKFDYFLTKKLKAGLAAKFSVVPGYDSMNLQAAMGYRF